MTELFKLPPGQESQQFDFMETISTILQSTIPDATSGLDPSTNNTASSTDPSSAPAESSAPNAVDEFIEFFDFTSYDALADDDSGSKAPTPELVPSSSANPSPESGSEADAVGHSLNVDLKIGDFLDLSDPLRLGPWKEIDGGEAAYHLQPDWKWDSSMPISDQPWAVFTC